MLILFTYYTSGSTIFIPYSWLKVSLYGKGKNEIKACKGLFNDATVASINRKKPLQSGPLSFIESFLSPLYVYLFIYNFFQCSDGLQTSPLPEAAELLDLLNHIEFEGLFFAHDKLAERQVSHLKIRYFFSLYFLVSF